MTHESITGSPYLIGAGLGAVETLAFLTAERGLGVSTAFENIAALTERRLAPDLTRINQYLQKRDETPKLDWELFLVLGIAAGSYLTSRVSSSKKPEGFSSIWTDRFGSNPGKRFIASFLGGALMMAGARMAKGCTSGHGITGTMQLAVSSWIFTPLMFVSAVLTARGLYRQGRAVH